MADVARSSSSSVGGTSDAVATDGPKRVKKKGSLKKAANVKTIVRLRPLLSCDGTGAVQALEVSHSAMPCTATHSPETELPKRGRLLLPQYWSTHSHSHLVVSEDSQRSLNATILPLL